MCNGLFSKSVSAFISDSFLTQLQLYYSKFCVWCVSPSFILCITYLGSLVQKERRATLQFVLFFPLVYSLNYEDLQVSLHKVTSSGKDIWEAEGDFWLSLTHIITKYYIYIHIYTISIFSSQQWGTIGWWAVEKNLVTVGNNRTVSLYRNTAYL
jgi:hypothetical protein